MKKLSCYISIDKEKESPEKWVDKEWLIANGLGGYSSLSIAGLPTRKYHGLLVSLLPSYGRTVMLSQVIEALILPDNQEFFLGTEERPDGVNLKNLSYLEEFYLHKGLPVWKFNCNGVLLEKKVYFTHMQNTVYVKYTLLSDVEHASLQIYPYFNFRAINAPLTIPPTQPYRTTVIENQLEISGEGFPPVKIAIQGDDVHFVLDDQLIKNIFFRKEAARGDPSLGELWSPGYLSVHLNKGKSICFVASLEKWENIAALPASQALEYELMRREYLLRNVHHRLREGFGEELVLAADQFLTVPDNRTQDKVRANAIGDQVRTIIAGYHWFADWGRDTMISLEGLTLSTGRFYEARWILRTFTHYIQKGLVPNMFPEGSEKGLYHTADASLWFFHALGCYLEQLPDIETLQFILPKLLEIYEYHMKGTLFGIHVDPEDGLLIQGMEGYQLTWMDAKVDNWVVTPRRGKAVEINALWYNALRLLQHWLQEEKKNALAEQLSTQADKVYQSFNKKFWNEKKGYLYDIVEGENGNDDALRPNQLFAISLTYPVLEPIYWESVFKNVKDSLLTPVGLRTLSPEHSDYKSQYSGDLRARDFAYHQGTVWTWLIGPYIDTWLKLYPQDKQKAHEFLLGFRDRLMDAGIGYISEIFDATEPYKARGCIAQAWSIAEVLRCLSKTFS